MRRLSPELVELLEFGQRAKANGLPPKLARRPGGAGAAFACYSGWRVSWSSATGLVHELGEVQVGEQRLTRFQFRHLLFQEYLYGQLSPGRKSACIALQP